jgi:hypothetical protein
MFMYFDVAASRDDAAPLGGHCLLPNFEKAVTDRPHLTTDQQMLLSVASDADLAGPPGKPALSKFDRTSGTGQTKIPEVGCCRTCGAAGSDVLYPAEVVPSSELAIFNGKQQDEFCSECL